MAAQRSISAYRAAAASAQHGRQAALFALARAQKQQR